MRIITFFIRKNIRNINQRYTSLQLMEDADESILELWETLLENEVKFIMISGFTVKNPGVVDVVQDFDILIENTTENFRPFVKTLITCGISDFIRPPDDDRPAEFTTIQLANSMELDIFTLLPGFERIPFEELMRISVPIHSGFDSVLKLSRSMMNEYL